MSKNTIDYEALLPNIPYEDAPIPKRIHQIFLGKPADQLPDAMKENVQYICRINPDWEYHLWSEEDIDSFILTLQQRDPALFPYDLPRLPS